jgi:hypothetical protein
VVCTLYETTPRGSVGDPENGQLTGTPSVANPLVG